MKFYSILYIASSIILSSLLYLYLHKKTRISKSFLFKDNLLVIILAFSGSLYLNKIVNYQWVWILGIIWIAVSVPGIAFAITMIRFWRKPCRKVSQAPNEIISPADGNVIYINKISKDEKPVSIKNGSLSKLDEITKTDLLITPCWLIGINMTPFDVHKNCAPISGKIILNLHTNGKYFSLKEFRALKENERNTLVIKNEKLIVGVVQIASKLVRRIDSYINEGDLIRKGEWFGMIRFGSQVDVIVPAAVDLKIELGQQLYARKTVLGIIE